MMNYPFSTIEKKWQQHWKKNKSFKTDTANTHNKPKFYVLTMFPYPSGAGLHVGHPLGYIAADIVARYKRQKGFHVLHPMGFDAFGLPAEQYALQTGQHPAVTTQKNRQQYKLQLQQLGLAFDWRCEVCTCEPAYYKWTQWIFLQLFQSWYDNDAQKARPIADLIAIFQQQGNASVHAACDEGIPLFSAGEWRQMSEQAQQHLLLKYRLAFLAETTVNWCPALGTVLANEEVKAGRSERGGHLVERKKMQQWSLRITAYSDRLLNDLAQLNWTPSMKTMQSHWIGKSTGAEVRFQIMAQNKKLNIKVFTTRPDTIFGVTFLAFSPGHAAIAQLTTTAQQAQVMAYIEKAKACTEQRDHMHEAGDTTGVFTGAYAVHPFTRKKIPIWIADYVLTHYGTGIVMGVPSHDRRDHAFARHYDLSIIQVIKGSDVQKSADETKTGTLVNSDFLNSLTVVEATKAVINQMEKEKLGLRKTHYRLRDAVFSRQRYWGEPIPVYYRDGLPYPLSDDELPLRLPEVNNFHPTAKGKPPLGNAPGWHTAEGYPYELSTMPGWAGSSWYFFRYMDPHNTKAFVSKSAQAYWQAADLYIGGAEHATSHLLYARFWTKFLYDLGHVNIQEPFQQLLNQGMIQGQSSFVYRITGTNQFVSHNLRHQYSVTPLHVDIALVHEGRLDIARFQQWRPEFKHAEFILENGQYICGSEVEKMSKSKYNVIRPDAIIKQYGADAFRLYIMFLGPLEQSKPWSTHGIDGVARFLNKLWKLFHNAQGQFYVSEALPSCEELKIIHKTIKKIEQAIQNHAFNTAVSSFMICVNELTVLHCCKKIVLKNLVLLLAPFAPHITEALWQLLGHTTSVLDAPFPIYQEKYFQENTFEYPVAINGKMRAKIIFALDMPQEEIKKQVLAFEKIQKWLLGQSPKKIIIIPKRMINVVV